MPKELVRKRGKRKPRSDPAPPAHQPPQDAGYGQRAAHLAAAAPDDGHPQQQQQEEADWVQPADGGLGSIRDRVEGDAPFGFVEAEVKAYFKTVDEKLRAFELAGLPEGEDAEEEHEDRQLLLTAALGELRGKELQLATDSDGALVVERMVWNMGDWGRRVLADAFMGNWIKLAQHRFGSHVVQTLLTLGAKTIDREERGLFPPQQSRPDASLLPLFSAQLAALTAELLPALPELVHSPFGSHPVRVLLLVLAGRPVPSHSDAGGKGTAGGGAAVRSKRSEKYAKENANFKPVVANPEEAASSPSSSLRVPAALAELLPRFWRTLREQVSPVEIRALGVGNVSGPVLQMLVELEALGGEAEVEGSLVDACTVGLVGASLRPDAPPPKREDYVEHLLRDIAGSHLLEALLLSAPPRTFALLWSTYFAGRLGKLGVHPVANYVVAKGVRRLDSAALEGVLEESGEWARAVKRARLGVVSAVVGRAAELGEHGAAVLEAVCKAFEISGKEQEGYLVPCLLSLKPRRRYRAAAGLPAEEGDAADSDAEPEPLADLLPSPGDDAAPSADELNRLKRRLGHQRKVEQEKEALAPSVQGCLLAQGLLRLGGGEAERVVNSLLAQSFDDLLQIAHSPISSRLIDAVLDVPTVPFKLQRRVVLAFVDAGFFGLVDDRVGSRVGEKIWGKCDGFLKEKIAKSLLPHEAALSDSQYGRFLARRLNLNFYRRKPAEWRKAQAAPAAAAAPAPAASASASALTAEKEQAPESKAGAEGADDVAPAAGAKDKKRKRKAPAADPDELDAIFAAAAAAPAGSAASSVAPAAPAADAAKDERKAAKRAKKAAEKAAAADAQGLSGVLDALRESAGGPEEKGKKRKKSRKGDA